jgi:hypothetical protein
MFRTNPAETNSSMAIHVSLSGTLANCTRGSADCGS